MKRAIYSCLIVMKFEFSRQIFEKYSLTKFFKIRKWEPSCSVTKLIVVVRNFANAPKIVLK
jgi:hypothetical protein